MTKDYTRISTALTSNCNSLVSLLWRKKCISLHYRYTSFTSDKKINASSGVIRSLMFEGEMLSSNFATDPSMFSPSLGSKGWRSGESTRLPLIWPGFKSQRRRLMWVEFVVGSLLFSERFFFSPLPKNNISKFQFDQESGRRRTTLWMCYLQIIIYFNLFIHEGQIIGRHKQLHLLWWNRLENRWTWYSITNLRRMFLWLTKQSHAFTLSRGHINIGQIKMCRFAYRLI